VTLRPNGPLRLDGRFEVRQPSSGLIFAGGETALCRCGQSGKKAVLRRHASSSGIQGMNRNAIPEACAGDPGSFDSRRRTVGAVLATQVGVNLQLRDAVGNAITSTLFSFVVGAIGLFVYALAVPVAVAAACVAGADSGVAMDRRLARATYVLLTIVIGPRLGAAALLRSGRDRGRWSGRWSSIRTAGWVSL